MAFDRILTFGNPLAVAGLVILLVVDSSNRVVSSWVRAHVFGKIGKFLPAFTNPDATTTVTIKAIMVRVIATLHQTRPSIVQAARLTAPSVSMLGPILFRHFFTQASARARIGTKKFVGANDFARPTITKADPVSFRVVIAIEGFDQESTKAFTDSVLHAFA
jgi:hypothetical protein